MLTGAPLASFPLAAEPRLSLYAESLTASADADATVVLDVLSYLVASAIASVTVNSRIVAVERVTAMGESEVLSFTVWDNDLIAEADAGVVAASMLEGVNSIEAAVIAAVEGASTGVLANALLVAVYADAQSFFGYYHGLTTSAMAAAVSAVHTEATVTLAPSASAAATQTQHVTVPIVFTEHLTATVAQTVQQVLLNALEVGAVVHAHLFAAGEEFDIWVLNTETGGVSEYDGYDYNSFARLGDTYYGAGEEGIYQLDGDDDAGEAINAYLRTGLSSMGSELKKSVPAVYIGYTSTGRLVLKVITTDDGDKRENWYALNAVEKANLSDNRFTPAKGLKSVYWQFGISNLDGADFSVERVKVWRAMLSRRK